VPCPPVRPASRQPDLFTAAAARGAASPETPVLAAKPAVEQLGQPSPTRHLLPKDLPSALGSTLVNLTLYWRLLSRRRGDATGYRSACRQGRARGISGHPIRHARKRRQGARRQLQVGNPPGTRESARDEGASLTQGQLNAVRAAFKAGVKVLMIARQFGISQSDVRKALASDTRVRNR
jgi:hypothetical protein